MDPLARHRELQELVPAALAPMLRALRLPAAARLSTASATPDVWRDIHTELAALARADVQVADVRAVSAAVDAMARRAPSRAAWHLAELEGIALDAWITAEKGGR